MSAVTVENISKNYRIYPGPSARLKELIFPSRKFHQDFWALRNVSSVSYTHLTLPTILLV